MGEGVNPSPTLLINTNGSTWAETENVTAFERVNLVPMKAEEIIPFQTVLVQGTRIIAIGSSNHIKIPDNTISIDGSNLYLVCKKEELIDVLFQN